MNNEFAITQQEICANAKPFFLHQVIVAAISNLGCIAMTKLYTLYKDLSTIVPNPPPNSILSHSLLQHPRLKAILFLFATGQELSEHTTSVPAVIHILEGECDLKVGGDEYRLQSGAWLFMEAKTPHTLVAHTNVRMLLLMLPDPLVHKDGE